MSATVEKAARRDLRRAVGVEAVGVIEATMAKLRRLETQANNNNHAIMSCVTSIERRVMKLEADDLAREAHSVTSRTRFWGRLLWLLTGK